jgi:hypothetical protein
MKLKGWVVAGLIIAGIVIAYRGCLTKRAPDERLAGRFADLCQIARSNVDTPEKGVRKLGRYMGSHLDDILGEFGATITTIEKIGDDGKHDERARIARARLSKPLVSCERDWARFWDAVEQDEKAMELMAHAMERLSRTLDILFGEEARDLRRLPREMQRALEPMLR